MGGHVCFVLVYLDLCDIAVQELGCWVRGLQGGEGRGGEGREREGKGRGGGGEGEGRGGEGRGGKGRGNGEGRGKGGEVVKQQSYFVVQNKCTYTNAVCNQVGGVKSELRTSKPAPVKTAIICCFSWIGLGDFPPAAPCPPMAGCILPALVGRPCRLTPSPPRLSPPPPCFPCLSLGTLRGTGGGLPAGLPRLSHFFGELFRVTPSPSSCPWMALAWSAGRADIPVVIRGAPAVAVLGSLRGGVDDAPSTLSAFGAIGRSEGAVRTATWVGVCPLTRFSIRSCRRWGRSSGEEAELSMALPPHLRPQRETFLHFHWVQNQLTSFLQLLHTKKSHNSHMTWQVSHVTCQSHDLAGVTHHMPVT